MNQLHIGWAQPEDTPALREIWQTCFSDPPSYVTFFLEKYMPHCRVITARTGEKVVGSVYLISAHVKDKIAHRPALYIYALGVLPAYRSRGIAAAMMRHIFAVAERESAVCILCPAEQSLVPYYRRLGMQETYFAKTVRLSPDMQRLPGTFSPVTAEEYARFRKQSSALPGHIDWDVPHILFAVAENEFSGGVCGKYTADGKTVFVFMQRQEDAYLITETLPAADASFLSGLCTHFPGAALFLRLPASADDHEAFVLGMTYTMTGDGLALPGLLLD